MVRPLHHVWGRGLLLNTQTWSKCTINLFENLVGSIYHLPVKCCHLVGNKCDYNLNIFTFFLIFPCWLTSSPGLRRRQLALNLLAWRTWMAHLMLRWWSWLVTFRIRRSFWANDNENETVRIIFYLMLYIWKSDLLLIKSYHCEVLYHSPIYSSFVELIFILRQTNIIQPACKYENGNFF